MHPILKEIKRLLLLPSPILSISSTSSTSTPFTPSTPSTPLISSSTLSSNINSEIENANDVFVLIEQVEISELDELINRNNNNQRIQDNNNQRIQGNNNQNKINLN
jgi:hypothetical protein